MKNHLKVLWLGCKSIAWALKALFLLLAIIAAFMGFFYLAVISWEKYQWVKYLSVGLLVLATIWRILWVVGSEFADAGVDCEDEEDEKD